MATTNPNFYGASNVDTSNQIEDGVDYPHTGLLKALSLGLTNTYAISGFNASSVTATAITVAAGVIIRNGEKVAVTGATLAINSSHTTGYNLLVAPAGATPTVVIRASAAVDKVPAYTDKDTIIAVLTHTGTNPMQIQYLTLNPKTNSLSIAYDSSGYTEAMSITGSAARTTFTNRIADADIRFMLADSTSAEKFEIYEDAGDTELFSVTGAGTAEVKGTLIANALNVGANAELTITESSDNITFTNTVNDKTLNFIVNDDGGADKTATLTAVTAALGSTAVPANRLVLKGVEEVFIIAASDETTNLATGDDKVIFHAPFAFHVTGVKASLSAAPTGRTLEADIDRIRSGATRVSILSTKISIDASELTSLTAAAPAVISTGNDSAGAALVQINNDDAITVNIDNVGSSNTGKGLKVTLYGYRT